MENQNHQALTNRSEESLTLRRRSKILSGVTTSGVVAADLMGEIVSTRDMQECMLAMEQNFGKSYAVEMKGRVALLFEKCLEKDWSALRFRAAVDWILEHKPYPNWTLADFFSAPLQKLYPYTEYTRLLQERGKGFNAEIQWYKINGMSLWAYKHEGELPFEKITEKRDEPEPEGKYASAEDLRKAFENVRFTGHIGRQIKEALPLEEKFPVND